MQQTKRIIAILFIGMLILLAYSTFVEQAHGAEYAHLHIYGTLWFCIFWGILALFSVIYYIRRVPSGNPRNILNKLPAHLLHASFLLILIGAAVTHFFGQEGELHLRPNHPTSHYTEKTNGTSTEMPIELSLRKFHIVYNPGTNAPADFVSEVTWKEPSGNKSHPATISMNNILTTHGYRFYQASFDEDRKGTTLTVTHDPWGIAISYFGYAMLAFSMLLLLVSRRGEFRQLLRHPALRRTALLLILLNTGGNTALAARQIPTVNTAKAQQAARQQVMYNNRVAPFSTLAHDFLQKVYGKSTYKGLSAEQVVIGWMMRPDVWKAEKLIKIKDSDLRRQLSVDGRYASMADLFTAEGKYKLLPLLEQAGQDAAGSKSLRELDEKAGLLLMAANGQLVQPVPLGVERLSDRQVSAEILYNNVPFAKVTFMLNLTLGFLLFIILVVRGHLPRWSHTIGNILLAAAFIAMTASYLLRWYIAGRIPLANGFETMLFLSISIMLFTLLLHRRFPFLLPFGFLLSGFTLLVSHLGQMNPQITPLMPVLQSPLLSSHVSIIMMAYALLALMTFNGIYALILLARGTSSHTVETITVLSRLLLYPATFFLGIGIFLGAVWANVSWGTYWSWDPKEVWALITFMLYGVAFHRRSITFLQSPKWFHLYLVMAFLAVLMTYFGVNYFLGGMHSYA